MTQILHLITKPFTFQRIKFYTMLNYVFQNHLYMLKVTCKVLAIRENVVQIWYTNNITQPRQTLIHESLEDWRRVHQPKWNSNPF